MFLYEVCQIVSRLGDLGWPLLAGSKETATPIRNPVAGQRLCSTQHRQTLSGAGLHVVRQKDRLSDITQRFAVVHAGLAHAVEGVRLT